MPESGERHRLALSFSVEGDTRFISHRDTLRMFGRALARAELPVRFTEGFNPHPRMTIPLPRPVGIASDVELLVVEFAGPIDPADARRRLAKQLPRDVELLGVRVLGQRQRPQPIEARYRLELDAPPTDDLKARVRQILESDVVEVERVSPKARSGRRINARSYLKDMRVDGDAVEFDLAISQQGTVKPAEIASLLGYDTGSINHRIRRMEVRWQ